MEGDSGHFTHKVITSQPPDQA